MVGTSFPPHPMKTSSPSEKLPSATPAARSSLHLLSALVFAATLTVASTSLFAQTTKTAPGERPRRGDSGGGDRGNFNPQEMQARMLTALRERLEVTDDEEWKLISERIANLSELRRSAGGGPGGFMGRGPQGGGDRGSGAGGRGSRPGGNPEVDALSSALRDKLPDAEIKMRLERLRESRKTNEVKIAKAQEELRAVLSVRQEAMAVVFGLLP